MENITFAKNKDPEEYYKEREEAYKRFFGQSWEDIIDHWMAEDKSPQDAVIILGEEGLLEYCDNCKTYCLITDNYRCPYCGSQIYTGED